MTHFGIFSRHFIIKKGALHDEKPSPEYFFIGRVCDEVHSGITSEGELRNHSALRDLLQRQAHQQDSFHSLHSLHTISFPRVRYIQSIAHLHRISCLGSRHTDCTASLCGLSQLAAARMLCEGCQYARGSPEMRCQGDRKGENMAGDNVAVPCMHTALHHWHGLSCIIFTDNEGQQRACEGYQEPSSPLLFAWQQQSPGLATQSTLPSACYALISTDSPASHTHTQSAWVALLQSLLYSTPAARSPHVSVL